MSMTDAEHQAQVERLQFLRERWMPLLPFFDQWTVKHFLFRDDSGFENTGGSAVAETETLWEYLRVLISWNTSAMRGMADDELEVYFLHELMHGILREMVGKKHTLAEERTATLLAKAFSYLRNTLIAEASSSAG